MIDKRAISRLVKYKIYEKGAKQVSEEIKENAAEKAKEDYAKEKVGAVIYGVISAVNFKTCYDSAPTFGELIDILTMGGKSAFMQLFLTGAFILLAAVLSTSAAAYFSRLIIGAPIRRAAPYYVVAGALLYGVPAYISLFMLYNLVLFFGLLVCGALSLLCTHAIITYEKGKPFRI